MKIPIKRITETNYPCVRGNRFLKVFTISTISAIFCLMGIKACIDGHASFLFVLFLLAVFIIACCNFSIVAHDYSCIKNVLRTIGSGDRCAADTCGTDRGKRSAGDIRRQYGHRCAQCQKRFSLFVLLVSEDRRVKAGRRDLSALP